MIGIDKETLLSIFYKRFFGRRADLKGLRHHLEKSRHVDGDEGWVDRVVGDFVQSREHLDLMRKSLFEGELFVEHSQFGEVSLLLMHMLREYVRITCSSTYIVDVGANGKKISNSYDLLRHLGFKGLLIEANPLLVQTIREEFSACDVDVYHAAVSDKEGQEVTLWVSDENKDIASIKRDRFEHWKNRENFGHLAIDHEYKLITERLPTILRRFSVPDNFFMLSVDIEGVDIDVINDLLKHSQYRPTFLIIEGKESNLLTSIPILQLEYRTVGQTQSNVIFERLAQINDRRE